MLFEHAQDPRRELCRIERDGTRVTVHHHRLDEPGRAEVFDHESFAAARAEYDRQIVLVYERGYRLVRDWVDPPLAHDPTLEAMIAEDPYDDARWMVLADWVLTRDDARANIVRFEQTRRSRDPAETWGQYPVELFGGERGAALLTDPLSRGDWHAGHVRACHLPLEPAGLLDAFIAAPATRLVRDLAIVCASSDAVAEALAILAEAPCRPVLRRLHITVFEPIAPGVLAPILARTTAPALSTLGLEFDPDQEIVDVVDRIADSALAPQLRGLELGGSHSQASSLARRYGKTFAQLESLKVRPSDTTALRGPRI